MGEPFKSFNFRSLNSNPAWGEPLASFSSRSLHSNPAWGEPFKSFNLRSLNYNPTRREPKRRFDYSGVDLPRLHRAVRFFPVFDGHLSLTIRAQPPELSTLTHIRQGLSQARCYGVSQRPASLRQFACVSEHDSLVTGNKTQSIFADMDATKVLVTLLVGTNQHLARLVAHSLLSTLDQSST